MPNPVHVGRRASRSLTLTSDHVRKYSEISGDFNPLHYDEGFVAKTKFGRLVVQGGLTTGLLHALVATDLPGPGSVFLSQTIRASAAEAFLSLQVDFPAVRAHMPLSEAPLQREQAHLRPGSASCFPRSSLFTRVGKTRGVARPFPAARPLPSQ